MQIKTIKLKADKVTSLSWQNDSLIDWVSGGKCYHLNGEIDRPFVRYSYPFDSVVVSPSGLYKVLFAKNQTKGIILKGSKIVREINRSFYHANAYDFPVVLTMIDDGQEVLLHCPNEYCQLEIEEIETGKVLTDIVSRNPDDIFHSRLAVSPKRKWLLSAGWQWHPLDVIGLYDLENAITNPAKLDSPAKHPPGMWELSSAAFLDDNHVFVSSSDEFIGDEGNAEDEQPGSHKIALWSVNTGQYLRVISCGKPAGELMPISDRYVVSFYQHPILWDMYSNKIVHEWADIECGDQVGSISHGKKTLPIAIDHQNKRFAIANDNEISVVMFEEVERTQTSNSST